MADYGDKISLPGYDVKTATDQQLSFTSKNFLLKVKAQGALTISVPDDGVLHTYSISHGLSYKPAFMVLGGVQTASTIRWTLPALTSTWSLETQWARADATNLVIGTILQGSPGTKNFLFYYYIFYDKGGA